MGWLTPGFSKGKQRAGSSPQATAESSRSIFSPAELQTTPQRYNRKRRRITNKSNGEDIPQDCNLRRRRKSCGKFSIPPPRYRNPTNSTFLSSPFTPVETEQTFCPPVRVIRPTLDDLPVELLQQIFLLGGNANLPLVNCRFRNSLPATPYLTNTFFHYALQDPVLVTPLLSRRFLTLKFLENHKSYYEHPFHIIPPTTPFPSHMLRSPFLPSHKLFLDVLIKKHGLSTAENLSYTESIFEIARQAIISEDHLLMRYIYDGLGLSVGCPPQLLALAIEMGTPESIVRFFILDCDEDDDTTVWLAAVGRKRWGGVSSMLKRPAVGILNLLLDSVGSIPKDAQMYMPERMWHLYRD